MRNFAFTHEKQYYVQVEKRRAKKLFDAGKTILLCPCKLRPMGPWSVGTFVDNSNGDKFDDLCSNFEYYNLSSETGRYITYYALAKDSENI